MEPHDPGRPAEESARSAMHWDSAEELVAEQERVGSLHAPDWQPSADPLRIAAAFVAFAEGEQGPGRAGDTAWVGAVLWEERASGGGGAVSHSVVAELEAGDRYRPGLLALREGAMLASAFGDLLAQGPPVDVLMVDATGRDHPRSCGLAVHLGWKLDIPSIGVTHRLLTERDRQPPPQPEDGRSRPIVLPGRSSAEVAWVWTAPAARPVAVHAGWRTGLDAAVEVALRSSSGARTPEPLREARTVARETRSASG